MPPLKLNRQHLDEIHRKHIAAGLLRQHAEAINATLREIGANHFDLVLPETHTLPLLIHTDERITGVLYGHYEQEREPKKGRGALVATDRRVLLIDRKPLYVHCEEISYDIVSAVTYSRVGTGTTIILHTRIGDITMHTYNQTCSHYFVEAIEDRIFTKQRQNTGNKDATETS